MSSDHVLDAIDGCLADYAMSVDAMRWNPNAAAAADAADEDLPSWQRAHADALAGVGYDRADLPPCQNVSLAGARTAAASRPFPRRRA